MYHDLRMLNSVVIKQWGPLMNKFTRLQSVRKGHMFSSFDLAKGFQQIPILKEDNKYSGFYLEGQLFLFKRFYLDTVGPWYMKEASYMHFTIM